jgi:hypothetical protein
MASKAESKADKEDSILENLTGGQIQEVLDFLILNAIAPIILNSDIFDVQIIYILSIVTKNKKRKLSSLDREVLISQLCKYLVCKDRKAKLEILRDLKLERNFLYGFATMVIRKLDDYATFYQKSLVCNDDLQSSIYDKKICAIAKELKIHSDKLFIVHHQVADYLKLVFEFRNVIITNYSKYAFKQAKAYCASKPANSVDFNDVWHNFLTVMAKAIDKYDCSKGALTSYINWWLLNIQTASNSNHGHEYGIAFSIPQLHKKDIAINGSAEVNFSVSLESLFPSGFDSEELDGLFLNHHPDIQTDIETTEEGDIIKYLVKKADLDGGLARLYLDIGEFFSEKELLKMSKITKATVANKTVNI